MISALQKILQKHHKWLFSILLVVVTISFVFTVGSSPGIGRNPQGRNQKIFGCDLSSQKEVAQWMQEVELSAQLKKIFIGLPQLKEFVLFARLAMLKSADDLDIPFPQKDQLNQYIETFSEFQDENKKFDAEKYNHYLDRLAKDSVQQGIFERTVANDFRISIVEKLLSGQGYSTDAGAKLSLQSEKTKYSFSVASFSNVNFPENEKYTEEELAQYFAGNKDTYKIGEQIVLEYVEFSADLFRDKITAPSKTELQTFYKINKPLFKDIKKDSDELRAAIAKAYDENEIKKLAMDAADRFIYQLYEKNIPRHSSEFSQLLDAQKLSVKALDPITLGQFSGNQYFSSEPLAQGAKLTVDRYYSDPVLSKSDGVCVLLYKDMIPAIYPPLETVRERLAQDFSKHRSEKFFDEKMQSIRNQLADSKVVAREQFEKIVQENGGILENFEDIGINPNAHNKGHEAVHSLPVGGLSDIITQDELTKKIMLLFAKNVPAEYDSGEISKKSLAMEKVDKSLFNNYTLEIILDGMGVKEGREQIAQQFKSIAPIYYMQLNRSDFDI